MKNFFEKNKKKLMSGFMMVEILVAVSIMAIITIATMSVVQKGISLSLQSLHATQASYLLEEGAEAVRIYRDNAWTNISNLSTSTTYYPVFASSTWTLSVTPQQVGSFTRTVIVSAVNRDANEDIASVGVNDPGTKKITVNVSWQEGGQTISKNLSFYISNIFI